MPEPGLLDGVKAGRCGPYMLRGFPAHAVPLPAAVDLPQIHGFEWVGLEWMEQRLSEGSAHSLSPTIGTPGATAFTGKRVIRSRKSLASMVSVRLASEVN